MSVLLRFEIKKILNRKSALITSILMVFSICVLTFLIIAEYSYYDTTGSTIKGFEAIKVRKSEQSKLSGELSEAALKNALKHYQSVTGNKENYDDSTGEIKDSIYVKELMPYNDILMLLRKAFSPSGTLDYYILPSVTEEMIDHFYETRRSKISEILNMDYSYGNFSNIEKEYILSKDAAVKNPWHYTYNDGWQILLKRGFLSVSMILALGICILIAPIFASEYQSGADSVVLATKHGRGKLIYAKLKAGFLVATGIYVPGILLYFFLIFSAFGMDGWNCEFQILSLTSFHGLYVWQVYLFGIIINYVIILSVTTLTMLLSSSCKTALSTMIIITLYLLVPMFLSNSKNNRTFNSILQLFPAKGFDAYTVFSDYQLYSIQNIVITLPLMLVITAAILTAVALPITYSRFRRHQVS